jgi:hypothetical protein
MAVGGKSTSLTYVDVTSRFVFYVPDNYLVGGFPADGSPTFSTRVPKVASDPPQRGGKLTAPSRGRETHSPRSRGRGGRGRHGGRAEILDTFPRSTPFETKQGAGKLFWFTVASLRQPGLRHKDFKSADEGSGQFQQQLWMFAVDPSGILGGKDGSYPAFFLPFQDPRTSNHIAQWTQQIVSATPPPPPAPPPPSTPIH